MYRRLVVTFGLLLTTAILVTLASRTGTGASRRMFTDVATPEMAEARVYSEGGCWGDTDGDGDQDLLVLNVRDPIHLWENTGAGTFRDIAASALPARFVGPAMCAFVDLDNDGDLDLYITERRAPTGQESLG